MDTTRYTEEEGDQKHLETNHWKEVGQQVLSADEERWRQQHETWLDGIDLLN